MSINNQALEEWRRLVEDWRAKQNALFESMGPVTQAFSRGEAPGSSDLNLLDQREEQEREAWSKMDEFRRRHGMKT